MVNSIQPTPTGLPTDLVNIELPRAMAQPARAVAPAEQGSSLGLSPDQQPTSQGSHQPASSLERMLSQINDNMKAWSTGLRFDIDEEVERVVVSIIDNDSGEVLRTVPTEAVLRVAKMIVQLQGGGVDTQA